MMKYNRMTLMNKLCLESWTTVLVLFLVSISAHGCIASRFNKHSVSLFFGTVCSQLRVLVRVCLAGRWQVRTWTCTEQNWTGIKCVSQKTATQHVYGKSLLGGRLDRFSHSQKSVLLCSPFLGGFKFNRFSIGFYFAYTSLNNLL